jgi:hypothetical protein
LLSLYAASLHQPSATARKNKRKRMKKKMQKLGLT